MPVRNSPWLPQLILLVVLALCERCGCCWRVYAAKTQIGGFSMKRDDPHNPHTPSVLRGGATVSFFPLFFFCSPAIRRTLGFFACMHAHAEQRVIARARSLFLAVGKQGRWKCRRLKIVYAHTAAPAALMTPCLKRAVHQGRDPLDAALMTMVELQARADSLEAAGSCLQHLLHSHGSRG